MNIETPIVLAFCHLVGDFFLQSNWMATNKSRDLDALFLHCAVYSGCFFLFGPLFCVVTMFFHLITDYFTSRLTSKLWFVKQDCMWSPVYDMKKRHWFFTVIGIDQFIHLTTLLLTYKVLYGK